GEVVRHARDGVGSTSARSIVHREGYRMKKRILLAALLAAGVAAALSAVLTRSAGSNGGGVANIVLSRQLSYELGRATAPRWAQHVSSGMMYDVLAAAGVLDQRANQVQGQGP